MVFNDSHPIRATITIIWKEKYKSLKQNFDNKLKSNCDIYSQENKRKELLKLITPTTEFYDKFDIIGELKSHNPKCSYIIKEQLDDLRTSFDLFNDKDNIKSTVKFVKDLLRKTIAENNDFRLIFTSKAYNWATVYSLNSVSFQKQSFGGCLLENLPILLGWILIPAIKVGNVYFSSTNNLNIKNISLGEAIGEALGSINKTEMAISLLLIAFFYFLVSIIKWRQKQHGIRI